MGLWTFILAVVVVVTAGQAFKSWLKFRERARRDQRTPGIEQELERLRQRVEALETIVTDGGYDLRREIDRLQGRPDAGSGAVTGVVGDDASARYRVGGI